jgi:hypothetical protein
LLAIFTGENLVLLAIIASDIDFYNLYFFHIREEKERREKRERKRERRERERERREREREEKEREKREKQEK